MYMYVLYLIPYHIMVLNTCTHVHMYLVLELEVRLATEEEEKKLLQSRLEEVREEASQQQEQLRDELEKVWIYATVLCPLMYL